MLIQGVLKLSYSGPMFRYERPQAGRQRQFHQVGVEFLGVSSARSDVEVITLAWDCFMTWVYPGWNSRSTALAPWMIASATGNSS